MSSDGAVTFAYFKRALRAMNRRFVILDDGFTINHGTMVYLDIPGHPDSNPVTGLWEVIAVPSPFFYKKMPKHDTEFIRDGKAKWVRGWSTFFKAVCKMRDPWGRRMITRAQVKAWFDKPFDKFNSREYQASVRDRSDKTYNLARKMQDERYVFDPREMPSYMGM